MSSTSIEAEHQVKTLIAKNHVQIFTKSTCPYCNNTIKLLTEEKIEFNNIVLDKAENGDKIREYLHEFTKQTTVPFVFINGHFVGGFSDLKKLKDENKLNEMLKGKGAQVEQKEPLGASGQAAKETQATY